MSSTIDSIIAGVIEAEGGYVNNPLDGGGATHFGITEAVAKANGYSGDMRNLPRSLAETIYRQRYVIDPGFDRVIALSEQIGAELVDTGVNMGPGMAARFLQRLLNGFNAAGSNPDLLVDGQLGDKTIGALKRYLAARGTRDGVSVLLRGLNGLQAARYLELTETNKTQRAFLFGWIKNRVAI
ncbi:glycoside hydrolase family 108 protein [Azomonas macrocytogenes]|uniref:Lysozyme family protein n=1 Tax=Azomonas macrocytogenes TaxID=69962 RepID=A0A839T479_AZOMA|nr:glycosyl hydrolase 108 family protein [Azomonas macrocytogenes]MBB3103809.1 lysozyme family protein [Azomonas macrocytogenes]